MTAEQKRLRERIERLMAQRARMPETERAAISAEIEAAADQLARLVALACRAVEQPVPDYFDEWVPTPDGSGEPEVVRWPPGAA
jgi:hypothetical protein